MALYARDRHYCIVTLQENGQKWQKRIYQMTVQTAEDGGLHTITGEQLPTAITFYTGVSYRGAHLAEVLMSPKSANRKPLLPEHSGWLSKRDALFMGFGIFAWRLIIALAETTAYSIG